MAKEVYRDTYKSRELVIIERCDAESCTVVATVDDDFRCKFSYGYSTEENKIKGREIALAAVLKVAKKRIDEGKF